jgi:Tetracyclin repressor-like, C-terminal domain
MVVARDRHPDGDPAAQIVAASAAFRAWALGNHAEFRLVFASPLPDEGSDADGAGTGPATSPPRVDSLAACPPGNGADMFAAFFSEIFGRVWAKYQFHIPSDDELDPAVLAVLREEAPPAKVIGGVGTVAPGMVWMFERAWAALYGTVTLEVFGHIHPEFISSGALFRSMMRDVGRDLGMEPEWERLQAVALS